MNQDFSKLIENMTPEIYQNLRRALELSKWPDGTRLTDAQKAHCMEAILLYEHAHGVEETHRTGYIDRSKPTPCSGKTTDQKGMGEWSPGDDA
ncbi:MAG: DUF1315 family protein [Gammaproteobacteria bacterium]|nr:MAG: DUF1315 family protein [Gammaproteobacteria bacterium]